MVDERKAKVILEVEEKGAKEAARSLGDIGDAVQDVNKEFKRVATDGVEALSDAIRRDLNSALDETAQKAASIEVNRGGGMGGGNAPAAAKFRGAAGLIGGEAASNVVGVIDDVQDAFEGLSAAASAAPGALASAASALGPVGLGLAAVAAVAAAAFIAASQSIQAEADRITEVAKSRLGLAERLAQGLTTGEAEQELETNARRRVEIEREVARAQQEYNDFLAEQPDIVGGLGDNLLRVFDSREEAYAKAVSDAQAALKGIESDSQSLREAIADGRTTTEKAAQAEQKLANVRATETKKGIDVAVKAEQEAARVAAVSAASQQKRIASAVDSIKKYNDSFKNTGSAFKEATADIGRKQREGESDIRTELGRDLDDIQLKNTQDVTKAIKEDWRDARDEAFKNAGEMADIRREGRKAEQEALQDGNFKQLFLSREATKERLEQEAKTDEREAQLRELHLADVKDDLRTLLQQEQDERRTAGIRALEDLKLSAAREMAMARENQSAQLAQLRGHYGQLNQLHQQFYANWQRMAAGGRMSGERMTAQPRLSQQFAQIIRK